MGFHLPLAFSALEVLPICVNQSVTELWQILAIRSFLMDGHLDVWLSCGGGGAILLLIMAF
jgi:hypothetical protein